MEQKTLFALCILLSFNSCFKEKPLLPPANQGIGQTAVIEMGPEYANQFFYSLETNTVITQNSRFDYDIMFDCVADKFNIWLNTAKFMSLVRTNKTDLNSVTIADTAGKSWFYELGEFSTDSNSFGQWWDTLSTQPSSAGKVYIIFLGKDALGVPLGFIKMKVNDFVAGTYSVSYAPIADTSYSTSNILKDDTRNYAYFNFNSGTVATGIEPPKTDWDFCFTRYTVLFYQPYYLPYEVTGVLHNPSKVSAYMDSTAVFDSVRINDFNISRLLTRRDAVGYEWKRLESTNGSGTYSMNSHYTYFVKADEDKFYKLRFWAFDKNGIHGYPTFEFYHL